MAEKKEWQNLVQFESFHRARTLVDASGYLEACPSFHENDTRRAEKQILQPMNYDYFLGSTVLNGCDDRLSGNIKRLPENYQEANTQDFSPNTFYMLNTKVPHIDFVRLDGDETLHLYKTYNIPASFIIYRYKVDENSITIQFAKLPCSRSELLEALTKSGDTKTYTSMLRQKILNIMANEKEGHLWYKEFIKKISDEKELLKELNYDKICTPISGYYTFPILSEYTDDSKGWIKLYKQFEFDLKTTNHLVKEGNQSIVFKNANLHSKVQMDKSPIIVGKLYKVKELKSQTYKVICQVYEVSEDLSKENIKEISWPIPKTNITRDNMTTYLSSLLNQSQKMYEKTHSTQSEPNKNSPDLLTLTDLGDGIDLGFLITTDDGIKSGVPFTHSEYDRLKYTVYYSSPPTDAIQKQLTSSDYHNWAEKTVVFKINIDNAFTEKDGRPQISNF